MSKMKRIFPVILLVMSLLVAFFVCDVHANNLVISNVRLEDRNPSSKTVVVKFNISWENSWKTKINHDAIWLTVRLYNPAQTPTEKKLCQVSSSGLNPNGMSVGSASSLEVFVPSDKNGVFLRPSTFGFNNTISSQNVALTVKYDSCGFTDTAMVNASVFGLEMVFIPEGAFYAGDYNTSNASLNRGSSDPNPWPILSESVIAVTNLATNGYRYVSAGNPGEDATGTAFTISASYPKGYKSFYAMKYEITEGQWVEFFNSLPTLARPNRDLTDNLHKSTDTVSYRNTISCSGALLSCSTNRPSRALSYISWMDLAAFLDWAALRPMTELEYEKIARGPVLPVLGEFAWGTNNITTATTISNGDENGAEVIVNELANAHYGNSSLSGGDTANGNDYKKGPLRVGIFATTDSTREKAGAGYYGVMELSGNLKEQIVTIGNASGRNFAGSHGNGQLTIVPGYEGNADNSDWPGIDGVVSRGVTSATGSGFKGGSWEDAASRLRISDRSEAAKISTQSFNNVGGRGVRTYDGN
ncbi:MAG TPA: hypothetical protein PLH56_00955 [Candidatus Omnitrophota bacterium]|nr:hypothetical protein [Candidatus Omnitrophota bacterium]